MKTKKKDSLPTSIPLEQEDVFEFHTETDRYKLSDNDIRRIIKIKYPGFYDLRFTQNTLDCGNNQGLISENYQNSTKGLAVIDTRELNEELNNFKSSVENRSSSSTISRTFIININKENMKDDGHWVALVVMYQNGRYYGFYIDSCGSEIFSDIKKDLESEDNIRYTDFNQSVYSKIRRQSDSYNCGLWALENAKDINEVIRGSVSRTTYRILINQINSKMEGESRKRDESYFINYRKELIEKLKRNNSSRKKRTLSEIDKQNNSSKKLKIVGKEETLQAPLYGASPSSTRTAQQKRVLSETEEDVDDPGDERNDSGTGSDSEDELNVNFADDDTYTLDQDEFDGSDKEDDSTSPLLTLESETKEGNYTYCLQRKDIVNVAEIMYEDLYNIDNNDKNSINSLVVINDASESNKSINSKNAFCQELAFHIYKYQSAIREINPLGFVFQTFILEIEKNHWITLVLCHYCGKYTAYLLDPLRGINLPWQIDGEIKSCLSKYRIELASLNLKGISYKMNVHNTSLQALENASHIHSVLKKLGKPGPEVNKKIEARVQEGFKQDEEYFKKFRQQFLSQRQSGKSDLLSNSFSKISSIADYEEEAFNQFVENTLFGNLLIKNEIMLHTIYQVRITVLCFLNMFRLNQDKNSGCKLSVENEQYGKFDDLILDDAKKKTCIQVKYKAELEGFGYYQKITFSKLFPKNKEMFDGPFSIYAHFQSIEDKINPDTDEDDIGHLVFYTDAEFKFKNDEYKLEDVKFKKIDFQKQKEFKFLKDCLCPDGPVDGASFYQFSQDEQTEERLLKELLKSRDCSDQEKEIQKKKIKKFLRKMVFAVGQPSLNKLHHNIKETIIKNQKKGNLSDTNKKILFMKVLKGLMRN